MMTRETSGFGALLRRYRLVANLTQEALASRAQLSVEAISALERGRRTAPRAETLALLAAALELSPEDRLALIGAATDAPLVPPVEEEPDLSAHVAVVRSGSRQLPVPPTELVNRERDVPAVIGLLQRGDRTGGSRLVTLTGPGGVGKTRLALVVAGAMQQSYADGALFVDLSPLSDPDLVAPTIARALGLHVSGTQNVVDRLSSHVSGQHLLLVLDNFEHLVQAATFVASLLAACPRLSVLVTSRVALRVRAEQRYPVPPLEIPKEGTPATAEALLRYPAVRLFVARAQSVQPAFALSEENGATIAAICRRLDGLPLAIELAAARISLLSPPALLARLERLLGALVGGARDLPARQQTIRATIDWSHELLSAEEQATFARLAVFAGGCTLEAVEAVCDADGRGHGHGVLECVSSLLDRSLLRRLDGDTGPRLVLMDTLREYAWERLNARGEADCIRRQHAEYFLAELKASDREIVGPSQQAWLDRWEREHDNLRGALRWARESGSTEIGLRLCGLMWRLWLLHGHLTEGRSWMEAMLGSGDHVPADVRALAVRGLTALVVEQHDLTAGAKWCTIGLDLYRTLGDEPGVGDMLNSMGTIARSQGDYERSRQCYEESLAVRQKLGDNYGLAVALNNLGTTARMAGALERARDLHQQSLPLRREAGDSWGVAYTLHNLAAVAVEEGDIASCATLIDEALSLRRSLGDKRGIADSLIIAGTVTRSRGDAAHAAALYRESLSLISDIGESSVTALALEGLGCVLGDLGQHLDGARLLGAAATLRESTRTPAPPAQRAYVDRGAQTMRASAGLDAFDAAWSTGRALPLGLAITEAYRS
jgi:predicted ATPase/transcriptional regulator with XRE-family HTH domain